MAGQEFQLRDVPILFDYCLVAFQLVGRDLKVAYLLISGKASIRLQLSTASSYSKAGQNSWLKKGRAFFDNKLIMESMDVDSLFQTFHSN